MSAVTTDPASSLDAPSDLFRLMVEAAPHAMVVVDAAGKIAFINRRGEELFGYRRDELIGQPIEVLVPERFRDLHRAEVGRYAVDPVVRPMGAGVELFGRRKDGTEIAMEIGLNPMASSGGSVTLASIMDITERKRIEDRIRRANAELEQFAYIASHDLQEPLRMVASFTELLGQRYRGQLDAKADQYMFYAIDGARRMQRLIADLLAYSRVGSQGGPLVPVACDSVVQRVLAVLQPAIAEAGASLDIAPLPAVQADEDQLGQLLQNLIGNALKFRRDAAPHVRIAARAQGDRWLFSVADNGIGIETRYAERVFQMFQRLHERGAFEGSGIGLAIAKRIVERHGGRIWFESAPGEGTTFFFTLAAAGPAS
ncbi:MAG: PAS domain S-box protein [Deltaproteobacteria bacterium]|nr:MAG: PAS domain S-box protein [Deltaproteobacteria bacterium]TMQ23121.1 MAG: PAS domain S-box protein [Deltaproteobacteria bacterium]